MNENDDVELSDAVDGIQRYGSLRNKIATEYGVDRSCVHIILDGQRMYDSDKMKHDHKVKIEFSQPTGEDSEIFRKASKQKQHWKGNPIEVSNDLGTKVNVLPPIGVSSLEDVQLQSAIKEHNHDDSKEIADFLIPPLFKDISQLPSSDDIDDVSLTSGVGRIPGPENGNSEEFFVITQNEGTLKSESETELRLRKRVEELSNSCQQLRKHNIILQLYDTRIRSSTVEIRDIVSRNFQRLKLNPDTLKNVLSSDSINEDDPEKSLRFRDPIRCESIEVSSSFRDTLDSLARMTKKWTKEDSKIQQTVDDLDLVKSKNKELKFSVKYWKDKSKDSEDRLRGIEKQRDDIKKNLEASVNSLEDQIKKATHLNEQLGKRLEEQTAALSRITSENHQYKKQLESLNTSLEALEGRRKKDKLSIEKNIKIMREKSERLKVVEDETKILDNEVADLLAEKSELTKTAQLQWDENDLLKNKIRELQERMYEGFSAKKNPKTPKTLQMPSPVYCLILLFFAWDEMIRVLTSFSGVCIILPFGGGLFWLNYIDVLRLGRIQMFLDSFDKLIIKVCGRLCKQRKLFRQ